jgi:hypothetical protein
LIAGGIVEFIAAVQFFLYGKATKQFGAFHICFERTHAMRISKSVSYRSARPAQVRGAGSSGKIGAHSSALKLLAVVDRRALEHLLLSTVHVSDACPN